MRRNDNFGFRVNEIERAMIAGLAKRLQRSESDVVRLLIREAARELVEQNHAASNVVNADAPMQRDAARQVGTIQNAVA